MERSRSTSNTLNRKLRPITETLTLLRRKCVEYAAKESLSVSSPDRIEMGDDDDCKNPVFSFSISYCLPIPFLFPSPIAFLFLFCFHLLHGKVPRARK